MKTPLGKFPNFHVVDHPLIQHKLSLMRDKRTPTILFRQLLKEIALLMGYELTRDLPMTQQPIETPVAMMMAPAIAGKKIAVVAILRAGLGMAEAMIELIPAAVPHPRMSGICERARRKTCPMNDAMAAPRHATPTASSIAVVSQSGIRKLAAVPDLLNHYSQDVHGALGAVRCPPRHLVDATCSLVARQDPQLDVRVAERCEFVLRGREEQSSIPLLPAVGIDVDRVQLADAYGVRWADTRRA